MCNLENVINEINEQICQDNKNELVSEDDKKWSLLRDLNCSINIEDKIEELTEQLLKHRAELYELSDFILLNKLYGKEKLYEYKQITNRDSKLIPEINPAVMMYSNSWYNKMIIIRIKINNLTLSKLYTKCKIYEDKSISGAIRKMEQYAEKLLLTWTELHINLSGGC